jgi:hypothetical protein
MKKKPKEKPKKRTLVFPLIIMMLLSLIQAVLIIIGVLPVISSYSIDNILFSIAGLALLAYLAFTRADEGLVTSALNGAVLGFVSSSITCASALIGTNFYGAQVIGIAVEPRQSFMVIAFIIIISTITMALFSALVTLIKKAYDEMK